MGCYNPNIILLNGIIFALTLTGCDLQNYPEVREQETMTKWVLIASEKTLEPYLAQTVHLAERSPTDWIYKVLILGGVIGSIGGLLWVFRDELKSLDFSFKKDNNLFIKTISFTSVSVDKKGKVIKNNDSVAQYFSENIGSKISLDMVYLPGGLAKIGSSAKEGNESEKPRHEVFFKPFYMGKYPITQSQWKAIATLPQVKQELDPDPSRFKGDNRPVENISWYDAVECCQRLSQLTGREYRLPSESEWEYACRGKTKTPFYFGLTITSEVANYKGIFTYAEEPKGEDRHETTPVDQFPPNGFGLYDFHGNVGEWCADTWHDDYIDAPADGTAWIKNKNEVYRVSSPVRGGAWIGLPQDCRCAARKSERRDRPQAHIGLRVVCEVPKSESS